MAEPAHVVCLHRRDGFGRPRAPGPRGGPMSRMRRAIVLLAALGALSAAPAPAAEPEYIYGAELMTPQERERYRRDLRAAPTPEAEAKVRERHRAQIRERARKRGVELVEPAGTVGARKE